MLLTLVLELELIYKKCFVVGLARLWQFQAFWMLIVKPLTQIWLATTVFYFYVTASEGQCKNNAIVSSSI